MRKWSLCAAAALALYSSGVARATITVASEDFEDDTVDPNGTGSPSLTGPPTNPAGTPGRWVPNGYVVPNPWYDPNDLDPDTNWNLRVTASTTAIPIGQSVPGKQAFFQSRNNNGIPTTGGPPSIRNPDRYARDGILKFTLPNGTARPATLGEKIHVEFQLRQTSGNFAVGFVKSIAGLQQDQANDVYDGNGQPRGINTAYVGGPYWQSLSGLISMTGGFNGRQLDADLPSGATNETTGQPLNPDLTLAGAGGSAKYQKMVLDYTVGGSFFDSIQIDRNDGAGLLTVTRESDGGPVTVGPTANSIEAIVFGGGELQQTEIFLDQILVTVNPVPEPGSLAVIALAAGSLLRRRRR